MANINHHITSAQKRKNRVRTKIKGTAKKPRLSVFRSNKHTYVQAINDDQGQTLAAASDLVLNDKTKISKSDRVLPLAEEMAKQLKAKKIKQLVFDRGAYRYHGRIKKVAQVLREQGLKF